MPYLDDTYENPKAPRPSFAPLMNPELTFLNEAISFIKVINARTAMLIAEFEQMKKKAEGGI